MSYWVHSVFEECCPRSILSSPGHTPPTAPPPRGNPGPWPPWPSPRSAQGCCSRPRWRRPPAPESAQSSWLAWKDGYSSPYSYKEIFDPSYMFPRHLDTFALFLLLMKLLRIGNIDLTQWNFHELWFLDLKKIDLHGQIRELWASPLIVFET